LILLKAIGLTSRGTVYLADVLERIVSGLTKSHQLHAFLAWNWKAAREHTAQAAA
jgi:transposase